MAASGLDLLNGAVDEAATLSADGLDVVIPRLAYRILDGFEKGAVISRYEAQMALRGSHRYAHAALTLLAEQGQLDHPSPEVWVRVGAPPDPYRLAARITMPYALAQTTALGLHTGVGELPNEILIASPTRFRDFSYDGVRYRHAGSWVDGSTVSLHPTREGQYSSGPLGYSSTGEPVLVSSLEQTLVECARVVTDLDDLETLGARLRGLPPISATGVLTALDKEPAPDELAERLAHLLKLAGVGHDQRRLIAAVRHRIRYPTGPRR